VERVGEDPGTLPISTAAAAAKRLHHVGEMRRFGIHPEDQVRNVPEPPSAGGPRELISAGMMPSSARSCVPGGARNARKKKN
jgi:hypothetical protein